jgi:anti-anti-sigma factor
MSNPILTGKLQDLAEKQPRAITLPICGPQDLSTVQALQGLLSRACETGAFNVIVDLRNVDFMDSAIARVFIDFRDKLFASSRELKVVFPTKVCRRLLTLCGLTELIAQETSYGVRHLDTTGLRSWVQVPHATTIP